MGPKVCHWPQGVSLAPGFVTGPRVCHWPQGLSLAPGSVTGQAVVAGFPHTQPEWPKNYLDNLGWPGV